MSKFRHLKEAALSRRYQDLVPQGSAADRRCLCRPPKPTFRRKVRLPRMSCPVTATQLPSTLLCSDDCHLLLLLYCSSIKKPRATLPRINLHRQLGALRFVSIFPLMTTFHSSAAHRSCRCPQSSQQEHQYQSQAEVAVESHRKSQSCHTHVNFSSSLPLGSRELLPSAAGALLSVLRSPQHVGRHSPF